MTVREILDALQISYTPPSSPTPRYFMIQCVNPMHDDHHPSMRIDAELGHFRCYSCGFNGPLARLLSLFPGAAGLNIQDIEFSRALRPPLELSMREEQRVIPKMEINGGLVPVQEVPDAMAYLRRRGIGEDFIDYFELKAAKMAIINGMTFYKRVCIPIFYQGQLVSVEGRDWIADPTKRQEKKCIYPYRSMNSHLFHFEQLDLEQPVVLTEGIMDFASVFPLTRNLVASFGSELTTLQKLQLADIPRLVVMPDNDSAGQGMLKTIDSVMPDDRDFLVAQPPPHRHDPGDCTTEEIQATLAAAMPYSRWLIRNERVFPAGRAWPEGVTI